MDFDATSSNFPEEDQIPIGDEIEALRLYGHVRTYSQDGTLYFGLSDKIRQSVWGFFSSEGWELLRRKRKELVELVALSLPDPYAELGWDLVLLSCRDIITTTVVPCLQTGDLDDLGIDLLTASILSFHLVYLGFTLDKIPWVTVVQTWDEKEPFPTEISGAVANHNIRFGEFKAYFLALSKLSTLLNQSSSTTQSEDVLPIYSVDLPQHCFLKSLIGFAISILPRRATTSKAHGTYEAIRSWWGATKSHEAAIMEHVAAALVFPESIDDIDGTVLPRLPAKVQATLGVVFAQYRNSRLSISLLKEGLNAFEVSSGEYGIICAELIKNYNVLEQEQQGRAIGLEYLNSGSSSMPKLALIYVKIATADSHLALGEYEKAEELLKEVLSKRPIPSYVEVCAALRLNKIWRRTCRDEDIANFSENLGGVMQLSLKEDFDVQKEFLAELKATMDHAKWIGGTTSLALRKVLADTLNLYQQQNHPFHKQMVRLQDQYNLNVPSISPKTKDILVSPKREQILSAANENPTHPETEATSLFPERKQSLSAALKQAPAAIAKALRLTSRPKQTVLLKRKGSAARSNKAIAGEKFLKTIALELLDEDCGRVSYKAQALLDTGSPSSTLSLQLLIREGVVSPFDYKGKHNVKGRIWFDSSVPRWLEAEFEVAKWNSVYDIVLGADFLIQHGLLKLSPLAYTGLRVKPTSYTSKLFNRVKGGLVVTFPRRRGNGTTRETGVKERRRTQSRVAHEYFSSNQGMEIELCNNPIFNISQPAFPLSSRSAKSPLSFPP